MNNWKKNEISKKKNCPKRVIITYTSQNIYLKKFGQILFVQIPCTYFFFFDNLQIV
mgnify:CR=1 FL=1